MTWSPTSSDVTPGPTSRTMPAPSWPRMAGSLVRSLHEATIGTDTASDALYAEVLANALATHLVHRYAEPSERPRRRTGRLSERHLRRVTAYVEAHLDERISVDELAALVHTSPAHFSRLFRNRTGLPPHRFHLERRLVRARELLSASDRSIVDVALSLGFASQSHLSRHFRQRYGVPPGALRRR